MSLARRLWKLSRIGLCSLALLLPAGGVAATDTNSPSAEIVTASAEPSSSNETLRAYLQLQEQIHEAQLDIERNRLHADEAAAKNAQSLSAQIRLVEQNLLAQRARDTHFMVLVISIFAGVCFLAVVMTSFFQWRTVHRIADLTTTLPLGRSLGAPQVSGTLGMGGSSALVADAPVEQSNERLLSVIDRLERRIAELEHLATPGLKEVAAEANGEGTNGHANGEPAVDHLQNGGDRTREVVLLLEAGQSLLNEEKPDAAIECFDQALALDPQNGEVLVKKGTALEKARKLQEALECYDRAIAADSSMTIAYLYKGGLYNRMERFIEAVECYEQALRTQEKKSAA